MDGWTDRDAPGLPEIDALRGVAITLVLLYHVDIFTGGQVLETPGQTSLGAAFLHGGHTGASLFFVLSGFLLAPPFVRETAGGPRVSRATYAARRVLRIMPLYAIAVAVASVRSAQRPADVLHGVPYLFFLQAFPDATTRLLPYSDVWWSLATEAQFYLLLPVVAWLWRTRRSAVVALGVLWAIAYAGTVTDRFGTGTIVGRILLFASVFGRGPLFVLGAVAAAVLPAWRARSLAWPAGVADGLLILALLGLAAVLQAVLAASYVGAELSWQWWHLYEGVLWSVVLLLLVGARPRLGRLLSNPVFARLGIWSYSLYLVHYPVLWNALHARGAWRATFDAWRLPLPARVAVGVAASVALAAATHAAIERPFLRRRATFGGSPRRDGVGLG